EELALVLTCEAVQVHAVVAQREVRVQERLVAGGGNLPERLGRHRQPVADARRLDHDVVRPPDGDGAPDRRDHPTTARMRAPLAWQIATARASAAWSGSGGSGSASRVATIRCTWPFSACPVPQTACFTTCGVYE